MPFLLDNNPSNSEVSEAINYLLSNFDTTYTANATTGEISGPSGQVVAYLYKYLAVKYADSQDGSLNFSDSPTNKLYYGLRNTNFTTESTNPVDYVWRKVTGGFGTTKFLFYQTSGGRHVEFVIATTAPSINYLQDTGTAINLDILTSGRQVAYPAIYKWTTADVAPARPSTTTTFTWATGTYTAPAGWGTTPPVSLTTDIYLWGITVPLSVGLNVATSVIDWTNTSYVIYKVTSKGENGYNGISAITGYRVQDQATAAPTFTTPTSGATLPTGWVGSAPSVTVGQVLWYIQGRYNSTAVTLDGIPANSTAWTGPIAASVFQDIRSDNWNGSNPPLVGNPATWGTAGYYIERTSGSTYLNNLFARGTLQSGTTPAISGTTMTGSGGVINSTGTFAFGNSTTNISFDGTQMSLNGNIVSYSNILNNSATQFEDVTQSVPDNVWVRYDFEMLYPGIVSFFSVGGWNQSGSGGSYSYALGYAPGTIFSVPTVYIESTGTWYSSAAPQVGGLILNGYFSAGYNSVFVRLHITTYTANHASYVQILRSYR